MFKRIRFLREVKVKANWTKRFQSHVYHDESGITGLETAIILIAFIVVAAVFAFTIMTTGLFSSERAKTVARSGLSEVASSLILKGPVYAEASDTIIPPTGMVPSKLIFQVALAGSVGDEVSLKLDGLAFRYVDENSVYSFDVPSSPLMAKENHLFPSFVHLYLSEHSFSCGTSEGVIAAVHPIKNPGTPGGWEYPALTVSDVIHWVGLCWIVQTEPHNQMLEVGELAEITLFYWLGNVLPISKSGTRFRLEMIPPGGTVFTFERTFPRDLEKIMILE